MNKVNNGENETESWNPNAPSGVLTLPLPPFGLLRLRYSTRSDLSTMDMPLGGAGLAPPPHSGTSSDNTKSADSLSRPDNLPAKDQGSEPANDEDGNTEARDATTNDKDANQKSPTSQPKASLATCIRKTAERIKIVLPSQRINSEIQFMKDHALIGKFLGFWPTQKALHGWITSKWKPKGQVTLQLGPKGFFTATFNCLEDKTRVFEGGCISSTP